MSVELSWLKKISAQLDIVVEQTECPRSNDADIKIRNLTKKLHASTQKLAHALTATGGPRFVLQNIGESEMANPVLDSLQETVHNTIDVQSAAVIALNGVADRIQTAVDKALENGATAEQLVPVTDEITALKASSDALAAAVANTTPPTP